MDAKQILSMLGPSDIKWLEPPKPITMIIKEVCQVQDVGVFLFLLIDGNGYLLSMSHRNNPKLIPFSQEQWEYLDFLEQDEKQNEFKFFPLNQKIV